MGKKKDLQKLLKQLGREEDGPVAKAPMAFETAMVALKASADLAEERGDVHKAAGIRREVLVTKLAKQARSGSGQRAPGRTQLFARGLNTLPDNDSGLSYR